MTSRPKGEERRFDSVAWLMRDTYRVFARELQEALTPYGITLGQWFFLRALWEEDGLTQKDLIERAGLLQPGTSAALAQMARQGLIRQVVDAEDRRRMRVYLTTDAKALAAQLLPLALAVRERAVSDFSAREVVLLRELLERVRRNLAKPDRIATATKAPLEDALAWNRTRRGSTKKSDKRRDHARKETAR